MFTAQTQDVVPQVHSHIVYITWSSIHHIQNVVSEKKTLAEEKKIVSKIESLSKPKSEQEHP